jgi:hypothetical protein
VPDVKWQDSPRAEDYRDDVEEETTMGKSWKLAWCGAVAAFVAGCASQSQQLVSRQPAAIETALERGRFDLNCPSATATVLSQDYIQPAIQGP